jgi:hypothetical protein
VRKVLTVKVDLRVLPRLGSQLEHHEKHLDELVTTATLQAEKARQAMLQAADAAELELRWFFPSRPS